MTETLRLLASKVRRALDQLPYLPRVLALVWEAAPRLTLTWTILLVVQGLLPAATVFLVRALVDSLVAVAGTGGGWETARPTVGLAALMAGIMLLGGLLSSATHWLRTAQAELVKDHISALVHAKSTAVDLAFYDLPDYFDHLHRARSQATHRPVALLENMGIVVQHGITLVAMAAVLVPYGPWLPLALVVSTLPAFYVVLRYTLRHHRWRLRTTADERRTWYYDWLITARETAPELRLFDLGPHFRATYQSLRRRLRQERLVLARDQGLAELAASGSAILLTGGVLAWMVWRTMQGEVTLGDLALFYQAFSRGQSLMRSLLENVGEIYSNSLFLGNLFEFLALQPQVVDSPEPVAIPAPAGDDALGPSIRFHHVTFRYPGADRTVLRDLDLTVPAGQVVALVGGNGAGKSTLVRLLCRFYDPQSGHIEIDGVDLRSVGIAELRRQITVLFQVPVQYNATVAENIALGNLTETETTEVKRAAQDAGAEDIIKRLPRGFENLLGVWFAGGTDLSVGEWQRIALARAHFRRTPIIVLDEPTSAMDRWAEADWLRRFRALAQGRTAILITHRFTTARCADIIHVMDNGRVVESGSYEELLAQGGRYAESWQEQMRGTRS